MDSEFIRQAIQKLRADLMATNKALLAVVSTMTEEQRTLASQRFAQVSVLNEETAAAMSKQAAPEALRAMQEAEERMYKMLCSAKAMPHG